MHRCLSRHADADGAHFSLGSHSIGREPHSGSSRDAPGTQSVLGNEPDNGFLYSAHIIDNADTALQEDNRVADKLTGACMVALGNHTAGVMTSGAQAADTLLDASEAAGEDFWELPITDEVREGLHSDIADVKSSGAREGGAMLAAAFLQRFVTLGIDWAHLDIAGPAYNEASAHDYTPIQGTGFGVRTLVQLAAHMAG